MIRVGGLVQAGGKARSVFPGSGRPVMTGGLSAAGEAAWLPATSWTGCAGRSFNSAVLSLPSSSGSTRLVAVALIAVSPARLTMPQIVTLLGVPGEIQATSHVSAVPLPLHPEPRSEERRVGKECRSR